jgi:uncharacterized alkaline shock family protein YloU
MSPAERDPGVEVHVGEPVVTAIAGHYARAVPGVTALEPRLLRGVLGMAGRLVRGQTTGPWQGAGIETTVDGPDTRIEITLSAQHGYNCRELAEAIQGQVRAQIAACTGLTATVGITITDIRPAPQADDPPEPEPPGSRAAAHQSTPPENPSPPTDPDDVGRTGGVTETVQRLEAALAALDGVRLYASSPFDALPRLPGRPPAGLELTDEAITIHLALAALPLPALLKHVGTTLRSALAGTDWACTPLHLHADRLDGQPFSASQR